MTLTSIAGADINLYGGTPQKPVQNVTMVGTSQGPVNGIFVIDPSGTSATFKASTDWLQNLSLGPVGRIANSSYNGIINVPVQLDHARPDGSTGMTEAIIALTYDPKALFVSAADITLGSLPASGSGWRLESVVDAATGQIAIDLYSTTALTQVRAGSLVNIAFHAVSGAYVPATAVQLVSSVTLQGRWYSTEVVDAESKFVLSPGVDRLMIQTGAPAVTRASTGDSDPFAVEQGQVSLDAVVRIEEGTSLLGVEAHDGLAVMSNGSLADQTPHAVPANLVVTGALAFQQNAVSLTAAQPAGQALPVSNLPVLSAFLGVSAPQQLPERLFSIMARWAEGAEEALVSTYSNAAQDSLAIPTQTPSQTTTEPSDAAPPRLADVAVHERIAVVDEVFSQAAEEWDDFSDFGLD